MNAIAQLSARDRRELFTEAAARSSLPPFHLEKDFWVCWTLGVLFGHDETRQHLTFRGGTSLSKAWRIIERFSEDIDLSISRQWFEDEKDPGEPGLSPSEVEKRLAKLRRHCRVAIETKLRPVLEEAIASLPGSPRIEMEPLEQARDPFCIHVHYPQTDLKAPEGLQPSLGEGRTEWSSGRMAHGATEFPAVCGGAFYPTAGRNGDHSACREPRPHFLGEGGSRP